MATWRSEQSLIRVVRRREGKDWSEELELDRVPSGKRKKKR